MAVTNFAALTDEQKTVWSRELWKAARNNMFLNKFTGSGSNAMIQRITELTKSEKGARAVITLVADLEGDGIVGDNQLDGNEESINAYDQVIQIDQLRNANRKKGRMADQKSIVNFREQSKDVLAYWLADRLDQMAFLTLSGVAYSLKNNGAARAANSQLTQLDFAGDVTAPSTNRHRWWDSATSSLKPGSTSSVIAGDTPSYKMLVEMKAYAKTQYIRGIRGQGNEEYFHVFMSPQGLAKLKLDSDFLANIRSAGVRGSSNPLFSGAMVMQDGLVIHEFRHVYNTVGADSGSKWGATGVLDGQRILMCGAQALGLADLGTPYWVEEGKDYENQQGISVGKICGFKKPVFRSAVNGTDEDFGVLCVDTAI